MDINETISIFLCVYFSFAALAISAYFVSLCVELWKKWLHKSSPAWYTGRDWGVVQTKRAELLK